jgi:hypothetical protein
MQSRNHTINSGAAGEPLERAIREDQSSGCALLCALLDAEILFQEPGLAVKDLKSLWRLYCQECAPEQEAERLAFSGGVCSLADREEIARQLADRLARRQLYLPKGAITLKALLDDFAAHCQQELNINIDDRTSTWGGLCLASSGRCHHVLVRPCPVRLRAHPEAFMLLLCHLPQSGLDAVIELFVEQPGLRRRLAMVDPEKGFKINLTRSDIFVYFERYLRRIHGLRLAVHPELTRGLVDGGIMKLEKG